jgi:hypothetical protein
VNALDRPSDERVLPVPTAGTDISVSWLALGERTRGWPDVITSRVHAKDCLQAAEKSEDPLARENASQARALEWRRDGLAASKGLKLCGVCGRKAVPESSLAH